MISENGVELDTPGIEHDQHAGEADADRGPAPPAHRFLEDQHGQGDHEERCREGDGVGVDQRHARKGVEEAEHAAEADGDAQRLQPGPVAAHHAHAASVPDHDRDRHQRDTAAEDHELEGAIGPAQSLHHRVHRAEQHEGAQLEVDAVKGGLARGVRQAALFGLAFIPCKVKFVGEQKVTGV